MDGTIADGLRFVAERRNTRKEESTDIILNDWEIIDTNKKTLNYEFMDPNKSFAILDFNKHVHSLSDIFLTFLPFTFLYDCWVKRGPQYDTRCFKMKFTINHMIKFICCMIRIYGLQNKPSESDPNNHAQRDNFKEAISHFNEKYPDKKALSIDKAERMKGNFIFESEDEKIINKNILGSVISLGERLTGDEKLFAYTGNAGIIINIPSKNPPVGLLIYTACIMIDKKSPFLVYLKCNRNWSKVGESTPVSEIALDWRNIILTKSKTTILAFDSKYCDAITRTQLQRSNITYVASCKAGWFNKLVNKLDHLITKPGDFAVMYNSNTKESFTSCWEMNENLGKKYCLAHGFKLVDISNKQFIIPAYDVYKISFNIVDKFNRNLNDRTWPHRTQGGNVGGDELALTDFIFSSILQNVFCVWNYLNSKKDEHIKFKDLCVELSDIL